MPIVRLAFIHLYDARYGVLTVEIHFNVIIYPTMTDVVDLPGDIDDEEGKPMSSHARAHHIFMLTIDVCRVCRVEGDEEAPLIYPCKCSGSVRFVHPDW